MRRNGVAALPAVALSLVLVACTTKAESVSKAPRATFPNEVAAAKPTGTTVVQQGDLGATLTMLDYDKHDVAVRLDGIHSYASSSAGQAPGAGQQFVAARLTISNPGGHVISDHPSVSSVLVDHTGARFHVDTLDTVAGCPPFPGNLVNLPGGATTQGCVVFLIPLGVRLASFEFTSSDGAANVTGSWRLTSP